VEGKHSAPFKDFWFLLKQRLAGSDINALRGWYLEAMSNLAHPDYQTALPKWMLAD
jgi:hypothetical protein